MSLIFDIKHKLGDFNLSLSGELPSDGITVVFGPSGCGKSTLLRCLAGLEKPKQTDINFDNEIWQSDTVFIKAQHRGVAMVFQDDNLLPHLSVEENINYAIKRRKKVGHSLDKIMVLFDLQTLGDRRPDSLSGGERQRVAMSRALASAPDLLLMDEPMSALDDERKAVFLTDLKKIKQQVPIIYVTHSREEMMRLADHVMLMDQGRCVAAGEFWQIMQTQHELMTGKQSVWSVLKGEVDEIDHEHYLCQVEVEGVKVWVNTQGVERGEKVRLLVNASDVAVSLSQPTDSSVLNVLAGSVVDVKPFNASQCQVNIAINGFVIAALLTQKSMINLGLKTGQHVYAQIKTVALLM